MFNFNDINNYVYYITGYKDLIAPRPIKRFPVTVEKRVSHARRKRLKTYVEDTEIFLIFHEFCHFVEVDSQNLLLPNFNLSINSESRLRETKVRVIQNLFSTKIGEFVNKPFTYGSHTPCQYGDFFYIFSCYTSSDDQCWEIKHKEILEKSSPYRDHDFLVGRLKTNIELLVEST